MIVFNRVRRDFDQVNLVAYSETGHYDEIHKRVVPFAIAFERTPGSTPQDRVPPASFAKGYFEEAR